MGGDLEEALQQRAADWECYLVVEETSDRGWCASFKRDVTLAPGAVRLGIEGANSREEAMKYLLDLDEYERGNRPFGAPSG